MAKKHANDKENGKRLSGDITVATVGGYRNGQLSVGSMDGNSVLDRD
jgi:hypothetical protein